MYLNTHTYKRRNKHRTTRQLHAHSTTKCDAATILCLFFADDGMLLANNEEANEIIEETINISRKFGLEINKDKKPNSNLQSKRKTPEKIKDIKFTDKIRYLGIIINDSKKCFKEHRKIVVEKARKLANI